MLTLIEQTNKPAIVAVAGVAFGFAIDLCCACDIRYASSDATFSIKVKNRSRRLWEMLKRNNIAGG